MGKLFAKFILYSEFRFRSNLRRRLSVRSHVRTQSRRVRPPSASPPAPSHQHEPAQGNQQSGEGASSDGERQGRARRLDAHGIGWVIACDHHPAARHGDEDPTCHVIKQDEGATSS